MAAPRFISALAILLYIFEQETCKLIIMASSDDMETPLVLLIIREGNIPITNGPHRKEPVMFSMMREKPVELYMIWDTAKLMSRFHYGAWAGVMWSIL